MIVCSCNVIADGDIRRAILVDGACKAGAVYRALGKAPRCGRCLPTVREMLAELAPAAAMAVLEPAE